MVVLTLIGTLAASPSALAANSTATVTGGLSDSCRDLTAHSSKDISHVEVHYADGRVVKDETIASPDHALDGGDGDEIALAIVKSGTTTERFECVEAGSPPTALLEIETPPVDQTLEHCYDFFSGGLACEQSSPRTAWTAKREIPDDGGSGSGFLHWGCGFLTDRSLCSFSFRFRGTGSNDPDSDIASWSIDFGDGTSASGSWSTDPPTEVEHTFGAGVPVTLTVTDSAGQSDSDSIPMAFVDQTPD